MNQTSFDLPIILGSSSKYRAEVLRQHHIPFTVRVASIDEKSVGGSYRTQPDPDALTLTVAQAKMDALLATLPTDTQPSLVMTCDQVVSFKGQIREKPETKEKCRLYLESYAEAPAETHSAVVVTNTATGKRVQGVDVARQYFKKIPSNVIQALVDKGDVMHCCGGFLIEDAILHPYMLHREGDDDSIIGMPIKLLRRLLLEASSSM